MKLKITLLTLFFASFLQAQICDFGFKAGLNYATIYNAESEFKPGFVGGIYGMVDLNGSLFVRADVLYSQQGGEINFADFNLNYVAVPVVLHYKFLERFHAEFGLQAALLIDDTIDVNTPVIDIGEPEDENISLVFGFGYKVLERVFVDLRYDQGIQDVLELDPGSSGVFSLALRYQVL